jgi:hypothetical protein
MIPMTEPGVARGRSLLHGAAVDPVV